MRKIISAAIAALMLLGMSSYAAQNPTVTVDGSEVFFHDQSAIIKNDRTLVPARGVFEAMGATVVWHGEEKRVQIDSADNFTRVYLTIDSDNMEIYKFKDIFSSDRTDKTLDVPAQVINDRTMIPLRAVADAFGCEVEWLGEEMAAVIKTKDGALPFGEDAQNTYIYLTTEADDVKAGDEFDVFVNVKNIPENCVITSGSFGLVYDMAEFEYVGATLHDGNQEIAALLSANPDYIDRYLKLSYARAEKEGLNSDGAYLKLTMKALTDDGGEINISRNYNTKVRFDTHLGLYNMEKKYNSNYTPLDMGIDTTPIVLK